MNYLFESFKQKADSKIEDLLKNVGYKISMEREEVQARGNNV